ncbi:uncharacterized protein LOC142633247 [Castanea sativa]|uniref:uncharacterized protein LOC142633247 n=1 Tax=Castanea sativa TaxID=21020 RepID=UPI003F64DD97
MALRGSIDMNLMDSRSEKKKMVDDSNWRPWSELSKALFDQITKSVGAIDYLMFGCVCRVWRLHAVAHRQEFMMSQPPLVVFISGQAKRACYFYSIFDRRLYKATLPSLVGITFSGLICGYMIMEDKKERKDSQIWLLNPFTRHELRFPCPPKPYCAIILASLGTPSQEFIIVAINQFIQFCRSTDVNWTVHDLNGTFFSSSTDRAGQRWFTDGVVFKGKIYVLTNLGEIGVLNLNSQPYVTLLEVKRIGDWSSRIKLLAFDDKLLMIDRFDSFLWKFEVYELNFAKMKWVKMQNLKDEALFLRTSGYSNITKWRGSQQPMNCIYNLLVGEYGYTLQFLDDNFSKFPKSFLFTMKEECNSYFALELEVPRCRISLPGTNYNTLSWYFPNLCCNVDALSDNYLTS